MTSMATATFTVKGLSDTNDTVYVFSNNPQAEGYGEVLASAPLTGETTTINEFRIPQYMTKVFVGLKESDGNMIYKYVDVENNRTGIINKMVNFVKEDKFRTDDVSYETGDHVKHDEFGEGVVVSVDGSLITIAFPHPYGIKKMMAKHKSITKV